MKTMLGQLIKRLPPGQELKFLHHGPGRIEVMIGHQIIMGGEAGVIIAALVAETEIEDSPFQLPLIPSSSLPLE